MSERSSQEAENEPSRSLLHQLVCSCREDNCPRRAEADRVLAQAWDEGYSTCLGDFDIAARAESRSPNPYRILSPGSEGASHG